ncbi:ABC transporter substrate-binding protein [Paenibacillus agricola]|uniref:ABC transporter substrate-binding protein n=1 Tax=Paenibacillus agricola TaxID=2716264 RepID=A0ABX0J5X7_9BACL|nr:ABC transporter substrate-binding protein [Paenibacillus agricola]NHN31532.1 ABC transporter substrate-binding protein [Paenibacillus agricola]
MKKTAILLIFTLLLGIVLTACNSASSTKEASGSKELDVLKVGVTELPALLDPQRTSGNTSIRILYNIFETILLSDPKDEFSLKPMLATEWKRVDDYTLDVTLRKGVKFHNGDELTAKDVVFSFNRVQEKLPGMEDAANMLSVVKEVQVVDNYKFRIVTNVVDPLLEQRIASSWGSWIVPADYITKVGNDAFAAKPVGTGPYKVVSYSPEKVVLERFDDYWGGKPAAQRIEYIVYNETSTRMTALITGEVDIITQLPLDQVPVIEKNKDLSVKGLNISNMHVLTFNTAGGPLADKKVRQALSLSIDRQMLVDKLWQGKAIIPKGHQYSEYGDYYLNDYPAPEYNVEKAKKLLAESSYHGELIEYELKSNYYTFGNEAAEAIVDMWNKIGINAKVKFSDKVERKSVASWSNTMRFPDPSGGLSLLWGPGTEAEKTYWKDMDKQFIQNAKELASILDPAKRKELARKQMQIWDDVVPGAVLYYPYESWGIRSGLEWTPYSSQAMDFRADNFKVK